VADGVGTRSRSRKGAELACQALGSSLSQTSPERLSDRFAAGRDQFEELCAEDSRHGEPADVPAKGEKQAFQEYATTALVLCLEKAGYWAASVGDGAIYGLSDEGASAKLLTSINREGFANEVRPLTNNLWRQGFSESGEYFTEDPSLCGFCLLTDGLSESIGDPGLYFGSVWPELRKRLKDPDALREYSEAFCRYWEDGNFSDDDKTLLAVFLNP
jgi:serine/threonine protein phosphatase PrpC